MTFRNLENNDYNKNYLVLLQQLTETNKDSITFNKFTQFVNNLNENHIILVFEKDNHIIASGTLLIENKIIHGLSRVGHIEDIIVDSNSRGLNLGKKLITNLVDLAKKKNCYKVILDCNESNCVFYEKCGFMIKEIEMVKYFNT